MSETYVVLGIKKAMKDLLTNSREEFPAICSRCLGSDAHVKMIRQANGAECKTCTRPFTVFMWKPDRTTKRHSKTIVCLTCARSRNCCQACMCDITYGIPLDIRDAALKMAGINPDQRGLAGATTKNREVKAIMADKQEAKFQKQDEDGDDSRNEMAHDILVKLSQRLDASNNPTFKKSAARDTKNSLDVKKVDISKILARLPFGGVISPPPSDESIASFFIFGINDDVPQYAISDYLSQFGRVKNISVIHKARAGFVSFTTRQAAEAFAASIDSNGLNENKTTPGLLILEGKHVMRVSWGKPKSLGVTKEEHGKLSLVVAKVLKQLADKDQASTKKHTQETKTKTKPKKALTTKKNDTQEYKSLSADYEL
ncbi:pre-mRNA-splicing factor SLT11 [[Candida] anglica]|uniref:Pre-mRNA-splicing factor SLT11 n=1 Tax=[Candida] anglica TaxID=148631 RepID=A0ABP0EDH7_9ASCO